MSTNTPSPGWYPDPENGTQFRWWDGHVWTDQTRTTDADTTLGRGPVVTSAPSQAPYAASAPSKPWYRRWWAIAAAIVIAVGILGNLAPDEDSTSAPASSQTATGSGSASSSAESSESKPEPEPVDTDGDGVVDGEDYRPKDPKIQSEDDVDSDKDGVADYKDAFPKNATYSKDADGDGVADQIDAFPKDAQYSKDADGDRVADAIDAFPQDPSRSEITLAMENALEAAQDYLDFSPFSRQGLIDQLSSEYGSGFELADATWAVDQLRVSWNEQAVRAARDYLEFTSFSRQGLIDQLSSAYGSQFTVEQATYAVNKIGL